MISNSIEPMQVQALEFLKQYDISSPELEFIRHNENLTYKVTDADGSNYVLRIHQPIQGFSQARAQHSSAALAGEMEFLQAIGQHTDIAVQRPVINKAGSPVTRNCGVNATLLTWIEGQAMHKDDPNLAEEAFAAGVMAAKLHNFAARWSAPPLGRHSYGREKVQGLLPILKEGCELGLFDSWQHQMLQAGCAKICALMTELDQRRGAAKGMIHADLGKGNLIVQGDSVIPIDFCLCGHGYFYMDLGGMSADFASLDLRRQILRGYRTLRDLPEEDIKFIEGFFILSILLFISIHLHNPKCREWFSRRIQPICRDYIIPMTENRRFYENI